MSPRQSQDPPGGGEAPVDYADEIIVVTGEEGKRLGVVQAEALLDVLRWFSVRYRADRTAMIEPPDSRDADADGAA